MRIIFILHHLFQNYIINNNIPYNVGLNSNRKHHGNNNIGTHAEIDALLKIQTLIRCKKIKKPKKGLDLIVIRINKSKQLCQCEPCYHCTKELNLNKLFKINNLYYSNNNNEIICIKFDNWVKSNVCKISSGYKHYQNKK